MAIETGRRKVIMTVAEITIVVVHPQDNKAAAASMIGQVVTGIHLQAITVEEVVDPLLIIGVVEGSKMTMVLGAIHRRRMITRIGCTGAEGSNAVATMTLLEGTETLAIEVAAAVAVAVVLLHHTMVTKIEVTIIEEKGAVEVEVEVGVVALIVGEASIALAEVKEEEVQVVFVSKQLEGAAAGPMDGDLEREAEFVVEVQQKFL